MEGYKLISPGNKVWIEWSDPDSDWHGYEILSSPYNGVFVLKPISYRDDQMGWSTGDEMEFKASTDEVNLVRLLTEHELHLTVSEQTSWPDDSHYRALGTIQPMAATEEWSKTWDSRVTYHLGEAVAMIARSFTKGQTIRDLKKAHRMIGRAVEILEGDKS